MKDVHLQLLAGLLPYEGCYAFGLRGLRDSGKPCIIMPMNNRTTPEQVEEANRASEEKFSLAFRFSPIAMGITTLNDGRYLDVNNRFLKDLGYQLDEVIGRRASDLNIWVDPAQREAMVQELIASGAVKDLEYQFQDKYGKTHWGLTSAATISIAGDLCILTQTLDITERKREEEALQSKIALLGAQTNATLDGILVIDENQKRVLINRRIVELFNVPQHILDDDDDAALLDHIASITKYAEKFLEKVMYLYDHVTETSRDEIEFKSGMVLDRYSAPVLGKDGKNYGRIWTFRDITERKHAEEALKESEANYRQLFDNSPVGIYQVDFKNGKFLQANDVFCEYLGYSHEEITSVSPFDILTEESRKLFLDRVEKMALGVEVPETIEYEIIDKNGNQRCVQLNNKMIYDAEGHVVASDVVAHEITERKRAEEALRRSEELYSRLVDTIPDVVIRLDLEGRILFVNDYTLEISGYSREELEGQNMLMFVSSEDRDRMIQNTILRMEGRLGPQEYYLIMKDGRKIPFEVNGDVLRSEDGTSFGSVHVCRDISERKLSEKILKDNEERLRGITANMPGVVYQFFVKDSGEYGISYASERAGKFFGLQGEMETLFPEFLSHIHEEDRGKFLTSIQDAIATGSSWDFEGRFIKQSGEVIWFHGLSTLSRHEDQLIFNGILLNITERKQAEEKSRQSEEKFHKVFMTSPDCIAITRLKDGLIIDVNLGFEEMVGWKRSEAIGRTSFEINFWGNPPERDLMSADLKAGRDIQSREFQFRRKDGLLRTGIYSARTIHIVDEAYLIFILQDITEKRQLENDRQKLEQQLFQSHKMDAIGQLAGGVAHDFNNMLSVIMGNTELAMDRVDPSEPLHKILQDILNAGERSADLTRQLLAFARKQTATPKVLDLNDTVSGMLKMLRRLIGEDINLAWVPGHELWSIKIDPSQVDQILANLMVNARDAIEKTGRIVIETSNTICDKAYCAGRPECIPGEYVILAVSDDGCGMDKEIVSNIFEPFFTTKKEGQGTGLGLATVYGIVRQNNGFINVYSEPGMGTTFRIYLPRNKADSLLTADDKEEIKVQGGTETVMIVEDEEGVLNLSRDMLERLGYHVLVARKTDEAIRLVEEYEGTIDLLLTDVVMPNMNGKELSERIISINPGMKCLYMSGYTADVIARQGLLDENVHFIPKPFSFRDLAAKVRETLGSVNQVRLNALE